MVDKAVIMDEDNLPPIACIFNANGDLETIIVSDTADELANATKTVSQTNSRTDIPRAAYDNSDVTELAKYVSDDVIAHLLGTKKIMDASIPSELKAFQVVMATYRDQLALLTIDQRYALQAARYSMDTTDATLTLILLREAGGIVLTPNDDALADTVKDNKSVAIALSAAQDVKAAPSENKQAVLDQRKEEAKADIAAIASA